MGKLWVVCVLAGALAFTSCKTGPAPTREYLVRYEGASEVSINVAGAHGFSGVKHLRQNDEFKIGEEGFSFEGRRYYYSGLPSNFTALK